MSRLAGTITYGPATFIATYMLRVISSRDVVSATMFNARNVAMAPSELEIEIDFEPSH